MALVNPITFAVFIVAYSLIGIASAIYMLGSNDVGPQTELINNAFSPQVLEIDTSLVDSENVFEAIGAAPSSGLNNIQILWRSLTFQAPFWTESYMLPFTVVLASLMGVYLIALALFGFGLVLRVFGR